MARVRTRNNVTMALGADISQAHQTAELTRSLYSCTSRGTEPGQQAYARTRGRDDTACARSTTAVRSGDHGPRAISPESPAGYMHAPCDPGIEHVLQVQAMPLALLDHRGPYKWRDGAGRRALASVRDVRSAAGTIVVLVPYDDSARTHPTCACRDYSN